MYLKDMMKYLRVKSNYRHLGVSGKPATRDIISSLETKCQNWLV